MTSTRKLTETQLQRFEADGYFIARQLISAQEVAQLCEAFMEQAKDGPVEGLSETGFHGRRPYDSTDPLARYPRMMHPHRRLDLPVGRLARNFLLDPRVEAILSDLMGEQPLAAQSMFYFKPPGARGQDLHQDNFYLRVAPGTCMAAWLAVDDSDSDNGGMMVVPGSHKLDLICPQQADSTRFFTTEHVDVPSGMKETAALLQAGDVLFFNGSLIHGSYPNTSTDRFRRALICHYLPSSSVEIAHWYRPLLRFDGSELSLPDASGGGPCGTPFEAAAPH